MLHENGLFIFRRDFRLVDNHGLHYMHSKCKHIFTIFIFTPEQVSKANDYKSNNAVQFMIESLQDLSTEIHKHGGQLHCFYGKNQKVIADCIHAWNIDYICFNKDYTPYAIERDTHILDLCKKQIISCDIIPDYYLHEPGTIVSGGGTPYKKFTPFYHACLTKKIQPPTTIERIKFKASSAHVPNTISLASALTKFTKSNSEILVHGGRTNAIRVLKEAMKTQKHYSKTHNELDKPTTQMSAYIKFGCISIREMYKAFRNNHDLVRQLIWRDFYMNILYSFPYVLGKPMKPSYSKIKWHHNASWFKAWTTGLTGFPVVDAGMRQLNHTGYMHNRARLVVASFLTKTLLIDWREGEKYFAIKLTDYDPASNNGNWQWIASSGADSQPYFRIFNPWAQSNDLDPDASYIKQWIPELKDIPAKNIHSWNETWKEYKDVHYPKPICDYQIQKEKALAMFRKIY
uniref:Photolyase/cryptochrome alpha/beta domain-containing protein n=1 Tax=viral metagenome TaxID=1070528 RepID=A0A6C0AZR5_9ZZZZ